MISSNHYTNTDNAYMKLVVLLTFLIGFYNAQSYVSFLGLETISLTVRILNYILLIILAGVLILSFLYKGKKDSFMVYPYLIVLIIGITLKFLIMFILNPSIFSIGNTHFNDLITFTSVVLVIIILVDFLKGMDFIKSAVIALATGLSFSVLIPLLFFPEMIGTRMVSVEGVTFTGAFWNPSLISFISVGWLLIAINFNGNSNFKKFMLFALVILFIFGSIIGLSRAGLIAILLSIIVYLIVSNKFMRYLKVLFMLLIGIFSLFYFFPETIEQFQGRFGEQGSINQETRTTIWAAYITSIPDYFLFGETEGNYNKYSLTGHGPHSVILNWLLYFGIFGLLGYLTLLIGVVVSIERIKRGTSKETAAALYAWLTAYLSVALINETGFNQLSIYAAMGIIFAWGIYEQKKFPESKT